MNLKVKINRNENIIIQKIKFIQYYFWLFQERNYKRKDNNQFFVIMVQLKLNRNLDSKVYFLTIFFIKNNLNFIIA